MPSRPAPVIRPWWPRSRRVERQSMPLKLASLPCSSAVSTSPCAARPRQSARKPTPSHDAGQEAARANDQCQFGWLSQSGHSGALSRIRREARRRSLRRLAGREDFLGARRGRTGGGIEVDEVDTGEGMSKQSSRSAAPGGTSGAVNGASRASLLGKGENDGLEHQVRLPRRAGAGSDGRPRARRNGLRATRADRAADATRADRSLALVPGWEPHVVDRRLAAPGHHAQSVPSGRMKDTVRPIRRRCSAYRAPARKTLNPMSSTWLPRDASTCPTVTSTT